MALAVLKPGAAAVIRSSSPLLKAFDHQLLVSFVDMQAQGQEWLNARAADLERQFAQARTDEFERLQAYASEQGAAHLLALSESLRSFQLAIEERFVATVLEAARSLVGQPLPETYFEQALAAAAGLVGKATQAALQVAAADAPAAEAVLQRHHERSGKMRIELEINANLASGQCELRTPFGRVELGLEAQLAVLETSMQRWAEGS